MKNIIFVFIILLTSCDKDTIKGCIKCEQNKYELYGTTSREVREDGFPKISEACDKTAQELVDTLAHIPSVQLDRTYTRYLIDSTTLQMYSITTRCYEKN